MRAAITGAAGLVGFALTRHWEKQHGMGSIQALVGPCQHSVEEARLTHLRAAGYSMTSIDLRFSPVIREPINDFDVLFHLAAYVRTEEDSPDVSINDQGTERLLEELGPRLRGKHVVYSSTIAVVDSFPPHTGRMTMTTPCLPRTVYGITKLKAETILKRAAEEFGFTYTMLRLPTVYGPGYRPGGMFDVFVKDLPQNKLSVRIAWPGPMSIVEVDDLAKILMTAAADSRMIGQTYFVSSGEDPEMGEMAEHAAGLLGIPYSPIALPKNSAALLSPFLGSFWQASFMPHFFQITTWRVSLVLNGFYCDGSPLTNLLGMKYIPWREGFRKMFAPENQPGAKSLAGTNPATASNAGARYD
jgi:UDP-glucose 4-epimerase